MPKRLVIILVALAYLLVPRAVLAGEVEATELKGVAIYPFAAKGGADGALAEGLTSLFVQELGSSKCIRIVAEDIIRELAKQQGLEQACGSEACQIDLASQAKADYLVRGDLAKLGASFALTGFVIELNTRRTLRTDRAFARTQEELIDQTLALAGRLREPLECEGAKKKEQPGTAASVSEPAAAPSREAPAPQRGLLGRILERKQDTPVSQSVSTDDATHERPRPLARLREAITPAKVFGLRKKDPIGMVAVEVMDADGKPLDASVAILEAKSTRVVQMAHSAGGGPLEVELPPGDYVVSATSDGYMGESAYVAVKERYKHRIPLGLSTAGAGYRRIVSDEKISFEKDSIRLSGEAEELIKKLSWRLASDQDLQRIEILGGASEPGEEKTEPQIAIERAAAVRDLLARRGVGERRLTIGTLSPVSQDGTPPDEVQLVFWKK